MSKVLVIGGGPAGMFAAITAARNGHEVCLLEKNEKLGKKLFITGKGRCNITNACDMDTLFSSVISNSRFLYSSFYGYTNQDVIEFFEGLGVPTKTERGGRVFPVSDHSSDVIRAMEKEMKRLKVKVRLHTEVVRISARNGSFCQAVKSLRQMPVLWPQADYPTRPPALRGTAFALPSNVGIPLLPVCLPLCRWR